MNIGDAGEAKARYAEAERTTNLKFKAELYFSASKLYLKAVNSVTDDNLKRSLLYLSNMCVLKASSCMHSGEVSDTMAKEQNATADTFNSERIIQQAHLTKQLRTESVPQRSHANAVQVVRDMLALESALAAIGFVNQNKSRNKALTSEQMLRSTFAFNSDLGESFMVLDTTGQRHMTTSSMYQTNKGQTLNSGHRDGARRPQAHPAGQASTRQDYRSGAPSKDSRVTAKHIQNTRMEIENELNNPLVQSYLSTHAPSPLARSHFDFDNLSQSTISNFNKDTIDNTEGVLNLLQTVRRIGDENAQLLLKIELLSHLDARSAMVYKDIDNFKAEFAEKFECVRDMLAEFAEASVYNKGYDSTAVAHTFDSSAAVSKSESSLEKFGEIIQKELETRRAEIAARTAALAAAEAERAANEKTRAQAISGGPLTGSRVGGGSHPGTVDASTSSGKAAGIADQSGMHAAEKAVVRQQQLEKMVKALVARLEKSNKEIAKKNELLDKYVRIINQFQKDHPGVTLSTLEASMVAAAPQPTGSAHTNTSEMNRSESNKIAGSNIEMESGISGQGLDLAHAAVVASGTGGVVSTYRKPPSASSPRAHPVESTLSVPAGEVLSPPRGPSSAGGMPGVPGVAIRTGSGGTAAGTRKSSSLPPRTKHHSTTTLEAMQHAKM